MDTFTERMINRATSRQMEFEQQMNEILSGNNAIDDPNVEKMMQARNRGYREILRNEANSHHNRYEAESDEEDVRTNKENNEDIGACASSLSSVTKSRLKNLVPLYTGEGHGDVYPSPVGYGRRQMEQELKECQEKKSGTPGKLSQQRSRRLAHLATVINNWEDESDKKLYVPPKQQTPIAKPVLKPASSPALRKKMASFDKTEQLKNAPSNKKSILDDGVIKTLEMQGFQRCESDKHLVFDYKSPQKSPANCSRDILGGQNKVTFKVEETPVSRKNPSRQSSPQKDLSPTRRFSTSPVKSTPVSPIKSLVSPTKTNFSSSPTKHTPERPNSPTKHVQSMAFALMQATLPTLSTKPATAVVTKKLPGGSAVLEMASKYETSEPTAPKKVKDPTELSINDRKAIFERNDGRAILPKAPFGMPVPAKLLKKVEEKPPVVSPERIVRPSKPVEVEPKDSVTRAILERQKEIEMLRTRWERKREENDIQGGPSAQFPPQFRETSPQLNKIRMGTRSPVRADRSPIMSPERSPSLSPKRYVAPPQERRSPRKSSEMIGNLSSIKKIKVSPPKAGRIYPSVSDIETESEALETESEVHESDFDLPPREARSGGYYSDSDESSISLGQAVIHRARLSQQNLKRGITTSTIRSDCSTSACSLDTSAQESKILHEMDDFLDEALGGVSPPKRLRDGDRFVDPEVNTSGSCPSDSIQYHPNEETFTINKPPLVHTVSTYRKLEAQRTPKKGLVDIEFHDMEVEACQQLKNETPENVLVKQRIFELEQEMIKQTTIISQATQALNLCHSRPEFSGSMENVEAEKHLLLATTRRMTALHEVERLKVEKTLKPGTTKGNGDKGNLTIEYISLPIKMCPTEPDKTDYFLCLVTSGETVQSTPILALKKQNLTRGNRLAFTKPITLENLYCDFTVTLEVYRFSCTNAGAGATGSTGADAKEEKKRSTMLRLTPQKKSNARRNNKIPIESPGGPNSVRTPSFKMVGYVVFSLREVKRNKFTLNKVPYGIPLDGTVELSMSSALKCEIEYRGFLTQFEEISGFGAWKRKWALLKGSSITFWLYPEHEEQNKIPVDTVDLSTVKNDKEIGLVSREVCARPHTFMLETDCGEQKLLSADTVDDRVAWTQAINKSLQLVRAWGGRRY